ncbi:hypothetical protein G6F54_014267 [Rhizopus delemar]|nr:hypothetical protein G6F54_014267 [Rhizopus delemar]
MSLTKLASAWRVLPTSCWYWAGARSLMAALSVSKSDAYSREAFAGLRQFPPGLLFGRAGLLGVAGLDARQRVVQRQPRAQQGAIGFV